MTTLTELANEINAIYRSETGPFPYSGCRKVIGNYGSVVDDLMPDLNWFFATVCGYASDAERLVNMPPEEAEVMQGNLKYSFFEEHPQYKMAEPFITADNTPDLFVRFAEVELMRIKLLLFAEMERSQQSFSS